MHCRFLDEHNPFVWYIKRGQREVVTQLWQVSKEYSRGLQCRRFFNTIVRGIREATQNTPPAYFSVSYRIFRALELRHERASAGDTMFCLRVGRRNRNPNSWRRGAERCRIVESC